MCIVCEAVDRSNDRFEAIETDRAEVTSYIGGSPEALKQALAFLFYGFELTPKEQIAVFKHGEDMGDAIVYAGAVLGECGAVDATRSMFVVGVRVGMELNKIVKEQRG